MCWALSGFSAYTVQLPVKNGVKPAGCGGVVKKLSQPIWTPREAGIATWTKWPVQANELTPNNPDKWWFNRVCYYLLVGYIYNLNSVQVYLGSKIMNHD